MTHRTIRFKLFPGSVQNGVMLSKIAGANRFVWNYFLEKKRLEFRDSKSDKPSLTRFSMFKEFTGLRRDTPWLQELPSKEVRYSLSGLADAYKKYFRDLKVGNLKDGRRKSDGAPYGYPKRKSRRGDDGFTIPQDVKLDGKLLHVPKVGKVELRRSGVNPYEDCKPLAVRVKRELGKWYSYVCYEVPDVLRCENSNAIGVDLNVGNVALSNGTILTPPRTERLKSLKKRYQRQMERKARGSRAKSKGRLQVARAQRKIKDRMEAWKHQISSSISERYDTVVVEDLKIKNMTKSAKGTIEEPGTNVSQKRGLNRSIQNMGWGQLVQMLEYKTNNLVRVNPRFTSQTCCSCGTIDPMSRRTQKHFRCLGCRRSLNADVNAARNILTLGIGVTADGGISPVGVPLKSEETLYGESLGYLTM